jgi:hypothetical protein
MKTIGEVQFCLRFEVFMAVMMILMLFWVLSRCRFIGRCHPSGETYCLHLQGWRDKAEKWRDYIGLEGGRLKEWANQRQGLGEKGPCT